MTEDASAAQPFDCRREAADRLEAIPYLRRGLVQAAPDALRRTMEAYWFLITDFQNLLEDVDGVDGREAYLTGLKIRLAERLYEADQIVGGREAADRIHYLALAFETGATSVCALSGKELMDTVVDSHEGIEAEVERMRDIGRRITRSLPGAVHGPFDAQGERYMLRLLQRWSRLAQGRGETLDFVAEYLRTSS
jgi:hypothetical protein